MTTTTIRPEGRFADLVDEESTGTSPFRRFTHEDGSVTVLSYETYTGDYDPRTNGETYAHLVSDHRDYMPLDDGDDGIEEMRAAAKVLGSATSRSDFTDEWQYQASEDGEDHYVIIKMDYNFHGYWDLGDEYQARVVEGYFLGLDAEAVVRRYIEQERPEVLHYVHEWTVRGSSQSDWRDGWAYVLAEDVTRAGFHCDGPADAKGYAEKIYEGEMKEYAAWFAGDVYTATHILSVGPEYAIGDEGGYYTGEMLGATDSCGGFVGYDDLKDICQQFTSSPVVNEEWI